MLAAAVAGGVYGWYRERLSQAEAVILLNPLDGNPFSTSGRGDSLTNLETEAQLVRSFDVAELVQQKTGTTRSTAQLFANLDVSPPTNTQLLEISYTDQDPDQAVAIAQAFAEEFLSFRESRARSLVDGQIDLINQQIDERKADQTDLAEELAKKQSAGQTAVLQTQLDAVTTQINQLRARSAELQISSFNPGQVVTPARLHTEGLLDSWIAYAAAGALGGALLALLIAFIRSRMDNRIHHVDDILVTGRTILGTVSQTDARAAESATASGAPTPECFRSLRVAMLTAEHRRPAVVLIAPGSDDPVQSPVSAVGLALALAGANLRTTVVDTLAVWPVAHAREGQQGLAQLLADGGDPRDALIAVADNLRVVSASHGGDGADLFMSPAMARFLERLRQISDIVLVIGPGIGDSASLALGDQADAVITEVVQGHSRIKEAILPPILSGRDLGVVLVTGVSRKPERPRRGVGGQTPVIPASIPSATAAEDRVADDASSAESGAVPEDLPDTASGEPIESPALEADVDVEAVSQVEAEAVQESGSPAVADSDAGPAARVRRRRNLGRLDASLDAEDGVGTPASPTSPEDVEADEDATPDEDSVLDDDHPSAADDHPEGVVPAGSDAASA
ncbi:MAG: hypothetical protein QM779_10390 [Propionicimonas sp.]|uniref:hypothetical protein n=1 Tax=Propionicimonas sp. TaxID=1955623 RepID=UPI003D0C7836